MPRRPRHREVSYSTPRHLPGAQARGALDDRKRIRVTVVVRSQGVPQDDALAKKVRAIEERPVQERPRLTRREFERYHRAQQEHLDEVVAFAGRNGLDVLEVSAVRHDVVLEGPARSVNRAFGVNLEHFDHGHGRYRAHAGPIHLPEALHGVVQAVLGLNNIPVTRRWVARGEEGPRLYSPKQVAHYYRFPTGATGKGQRVAVLSFGGGFHREDIRDYFRRVLRISPPRVRVLGLPKRWNAPLDAQILQGFVADLSAPGATFDGLTSDYAPYTELAMDTVETTMDIEIAGAVAPGAEIDVYCAPDTERGFYTAILAAIGLHPVATGGRPRPATVVSISWGKVEEQWPAGAMWAINQVLLKAKNLGVTVCCASGDFGSRGTPPGESEVASVSFPASSPYALACGGTTLLSSGDGAIAGEAAWNAEALGVRMATGGGVSGFFWRPWYQREHPIPAFRDLGSGVWIHDGVEEKEKFCGRGVPDVAANADGASGYRIFVGGQVTVGGGTSAAAPLWAGLMAQFGEKMGAPAGFVNPLLYRPESRAAFREVLRGTNDVSARKLVYFRARREWNACVGLGSPVGTRLLRWLQRTSRRARRPGGSAEAGPEDRPRRERA